MPTLEQLPQAVSTNPNDLVLIEHAGVTSSTSVEVLLANTQPKLNLAGGALLGRVSVLPAGLSRSR